MQEQIKTPTGKIISLPIRMVTKRELKTLGYDYIENGIFFNISKKDGKFPKVRRKVRENMNVIDYPDFSKQPFDEKLLTDTVAKQIKSKSDFIFMPKFKDETDYDVRRKIELAGNLKLISQMSKDIILEISYKCGIPNDELKQLSSNFDYLAIHYGVYWGQYPAFEKISRRIYWFKRATGKRVFVIGVPFKFAGEDKKDSRLMPCFSLISDFWVKNWRQARGSEEIKMTDLVDLKSKTYEQFLESGYSPNQKIEPTKRTVYEMFQKDSDEARIEYEGYVLDNILSDLNNLNPETIENYLYERFYNKYHAVIIAPYREKVIISHFIKREIFDGYSEDVKNLLGGALRRQYSPSVIFKVINTWVELVKEDPNTPFSELIQVALNFNK